MSTEPSTPLPERDHLRMETVLAAEQITRGPQPNYRHLFRINLLNTSTTSVRLLGRKWTIQERDGTTRILEAQQVFNQRPVLESGSIFSIAGYHDFSAPPTRIELRLFGLDQSNLPFITPALRLPRRASIPH